MSQEKVDRYKQEKANRKKNMKKQKLRNAAQKLVVCIAGIAVIGWIGYSAYHSYESNRPKEEAQIDYTAVNELSQAVAGAAEEAAE